MRQRYAYGSNIAAMRCGWDVKIKEQWRIKNRNLQSGAVLWLPIALRALFLGILPYSPSLAEGVGGGLSC